MNFSEYISEQVKKHGAKGFRNLLASEGFDQWGNHKIFTRVKDIHNDLTFVRVYDAIGNRVTVSTKI